MKTFVVSRVASVPCFNGIFINVWASFFLFFFPSGQLKCIHPDFQVKNTPREETGASGTVVPQALGCLEEDQRHCLESVIDAEIKNGEFVNSVCRPRV